MKQEDKGVRSTNVGRGMYLPLAAQRVACACGWAGSEADLLGTSLMCPECGRTGLRGVGRAEKIRPAGEDARAPEPAKVSEVLAKTEELMSITDEAVDLAIESGEWASEVAFARWAERIIEASNRFAAAALKVSEIVMLARGMGLEEDRDTGPVEGEWVKTSEGTEDVYTFIGYECTEEQPRLTLEIPLRPGEVLLNVRVEGEFHELGELVDNQTIFQITQDETTWEEGRFGNVVTKGNKLRINSAGDGPATTEEWAGANIFGAWSGDDGEKLLSVVPGKLGDAGAIAIGSVDLAEGVTALTWGTADDGEKEPRSYGRNSSWTITVRYDRAKKTFTDRGAVRIPRQRLLSESTPGQGYQELLAGIASGLGAPISASGAPEEGFAVIIREGDASGDTLVEWYRSLRGLS